MGNQITSFCDLEVWKRSHLLTLEIYKITREFPKEELYGITSQIRRAASSVGANIAEGFGRYHFGDKIKFYYNARGSLSEVQNFLLLSKDLGYIEGIICNELFEKYNEVNKKINNLINSTENRKSFFNRIFLAFVTCYIVTCY